MFFSTITTSTTQVGSVTHLPSGFSHFPDLKAGGWSLFIIDYAEVIQSGAVMSY